jgi:hypothetical protein
VGGARGLLVLILVYYVIYLLQRRALDNYIDAEIGKSLTPDGAISLRRDLLSGGFGKKG